MRRGHFTSQILSLSGNRPNQGDAADREQACRLRLECLPSGAYAACDAQWARGS